MGYRPAPKGLPQTSHGYTVDFSRWPRSDLVGSGSFKEFGELATSTAETLRIEEGGYIRSLADTTAQYIGINPNVVGGFNGQGQFSECLCYLDATATQTNYWVGPAVFIGADQQSGVTSGEHHYTLLLNDAGGGTSDWQVYRRSDSLWNGLGSANGEPDVAGKHFLLRLEAYVLPDDSGVRLKCWKDGKLIIEVVDTNVDRLLGPSTVASHPAYGYPGLSWGNNGIDDPARWVKWVRGGDLPELSEPKLNLPAIASTPSTTPARKQVGTYDSGGNSVSSATMSLPVTATAGNLLVAAAAVDKTATWNDPPAGWTRIAADSSNAGVSQQYVYKVSDGTEKSVTLTPVSVSRSMSGIIAEYSNVSVLDVSARNSQATPATTCHSGTATNTVPDALAIAFFSSDSAVNVETGRSYSNSFSEYAFTGAISAGTPGSNLVDKVLSAIGPQETTFTTTDTGDEQLGAIAVFYPAVSPITFVPTDGASGVAKASNTNGQNLDITIDISDGADLLIILNVAWGQTTISLEDWVTTTEPFALLDGTQVAEIFPNLGGDVAIRAYGVVNPTAKVETITATVGGDLNTNYHLMAAVAYNGVDTASLNAAAKVRWLTNNNDSPSTTTIFPERGSANNKMLALCGALGFTSTTPTVTNDGGFTERARFASDAGTGNADGTIYIAEGGAPSPLTVTWPGSDENGGFYVELINAANVSAALGPFLIERPWTSRPPWGTPIDMTHPLARELKRFVMFDSGDIGYDFVQGVFGVPQANYGSNSVTKYGRAQNVIQSTGTQVHEWPDEATVIKNFGTLGHTFMALARSDTAGTPSAKPNQEFIAAGETAGTDDLWNYRLLTDGSPRYTIYYDNGTIANSESPYPTGKDATDWCFHGGTWDADRNEIICRIDRAQDATPGSVPGTVGVGDSSTIFSVGSNGSSSASWDGDIVFAAEWLRPLSDTEWDQMIDNPWQIFVPQKVLVAISIDAAGNVVITDVANSGETPGSGSESWDDGSTGNVITGTGFL